MNILVIDTETSTTSFENGPDGHIVEIGIAKVDLESRIVSPLFSSPVLDLSANPSAWCFENSTLDPDDVWRGMPTGMLSPILITMVGHYEVTSYNIDFDRGMIQRDLPVLSETIRWGRCLMEICADIPGIPRIGKRGSYPKAVDAYNYMCPDDPAHIGGKEEHRALSDAIMEGHILLSLYVKGLYDPLQDEYLLLKEDGQWG